MHPNWDSDFLDPSFELFNLAKSLQTAKTLIFNKKYSSEMILIKMYSRKENHET